MKKSKMILKTRLRVLKRNYTTQVITGILGLSVLEYGIYHYYTRSPKKREPSKTRSEGAYPNLLNAWETPQKIFSKKLDFPVQIKGGINNQDTVHNIIKSVFNLTSPKFNKLYSNPNIKEERFMMTWINMLRVSMA